MKNIKIILLIALIIIAVPVKAESDNVTLKKCVDGDTAYFIRNNEEIKVRFLAIDTPESTTKIEEYGKEASEYTCESLTNAKKITLEYDPKSNETDKYGRVLAWVYVDDELLESKLVTEGLAEVAYIYDDYKYVSDLCKLELEASNNSLGIWTIQDYNDSYCATRSDSNSSTTKTTTIEENDTDNTTESNDDNELYYIIPLILALVISIVLYKKRA